MHVTTLRNCVYKLLGSVTGVTVLYKGQSYIHLIAKSISLLMCRLEINTWRIQSRLSLLPISVILFPDTVCREQSPDWLSWCFMACRNYHVFYYLLMGASREEHEEFHLLRPQDYLYLKQVPLSHTPWRNNNGVLLVKPARHIVDPQIAFRFGLFLYPIMDQWNKTEIRLRSV